MKRHRFEPAALVMGVVLLTLSVFFVLDACQVWDLSRPQVTAPIAASGLLLAAVTTARTGACSDPSAVARPGRPATGKACPPAPAAATP